MVLSSGKFPMQLEYSHLSPIFKKGDKIEMSNYRPVSLLTSFSKVFVRVVYNRLKFHIHSNNILAKEQNGFRTSSPNELATDNKQHFNNSWQ
jgi:ribosomal protein S17